MSSGLSRVESSKKRRLKEKKPLIRSGLRRDRTTSEPIELSNKNEPLRRSSKSDNEVDSGSEVVPSRTDTYSSRTVKLSKIFLNTLIFLFVILTVGLVWWGLAGAPDLKEIW
ncbi:hypothetical protein [Paenibacillus macquariensis]|uniref:Uncharacterized protein n=1 Tax=Paenibacillus macquariensis TaxID=948756 RepID=A0ABY1JJT8_9BACL|nr:hypothetical protein [Paenibacillus macquariensis]MEC0089796.1 hypothetical protein [Paenibacillus macquariensis]OAB30735.1 hypothetical protein PMSM_21570 [Paenibacillus macquariensis subsp. macquariensis]SIQ31366.1 hypothetical protein SAMN05421578_101172 [Paenibacillus macquariensis]